MRERIGRKRILWDGFPALFAALAACLILGGCGGSEGKREPEKAQTDASSQPAAWESFALPGKLTEDQMLWAGDFVLWESMDAQAGEAQYLDAGASGSVLWRFGRDGETGDGFCLETYDTETGSFACRRFAAGESGLEENVYVLDAAKDGSLIFRTLSFEPDGEGLTSMKVDRLVYLDPSGEVAGTLDVRSLCLEQGMWEEESFPEPMFPDYSLNCDGQGNLLVSVYGEGQGLRLAMFSPQGELLLSREEDGEQSLPAGVLCTPGGRLVLPVYDGKERCYEFWQADPGGGGWQSLCRLEEVMPSYMCQLYGMEGDWLYYRFEQTGDRIERWNVADGTREAVFDFRQAGIEKGWESLLALPGDHSGDKFPVLYLIRQKGGGADRELVTSLQAERPAESSGAAVADLVGVGELEACAVQASLESLNQKYVYEDAAGQEQRDRILAQLSQGEGPQLLFVSLEDMYLLEEKGLLMDLGEILPKELRESLLPGALEIGTVEGRLVGIPEAVSVQSLAVSGGVWEEDGWTLEELTGLMKEGRLRGALRNTPGTLMGRYMDPVLTVTQLAGCNLENAGLIDWEKGECYFEGELFVGLLEAAAEDMSGVPVDGERWLGAGGDVLSVATGDVLPGSCLELFARLEAEGGRIVGMPGEDRAPGYLQEAEGVLVANKNTATPEAAACFLEVLLGEELQDRLSDAFRISVRRLDPERYIVRDEEGRLLFQGNDRMEVPVFADGSNALERAADFLNRCRACPRRHMAVVRILSEELSDMLATGKSPRETAQVIDSRVQLYLDENR